MKNFKNEFGVRGSVALIKAFKSEVESLGWKYDEDFTKWSDLPERGETPLLYFCVDDISSMKRNHFSLSSSTSAVLNLPNDWSKALELAKEVEEEIPKTRYYKFTGKGVSTTYFTQDKIYKFREGRTLEDFNAFVDDRGSSNGFQGSNENCFTPSTEQEYNAQQEEFRKKELLEEAVRKYPVGTKFKDLTNLNLAVNNALEVKGELYWNKEGITGFGFGYVYYHNQWAEIVEDEFKVGDYVTIIKENSSCNKLGDVGIITELGEGDFRITVPSRMNKGNWSVLEDFRKATPSEIEKYKAENEIEIGGYKTEFKNGKVSFGCKKDITKEDLLAIQRVREFCKKYEVRLDFYGGGSLTLNADGGHETEISVGLLHKLISKL